MIATCEIRWQCSCFMVFRRTGRVAVRANISGETHAEVAVAVDDLARCVVHARRTATRFCKAMISVD